jgi:hypothetical protein
LYFTSRDNIIYSSVGYSLIAAGISGSLLYIYAIIDIKKKQKLDRLNSLGIIDIFPVRAAEIKNEYDSRLNKAKKRVDIIGFGLRALREDYGQKFPEWAARFEIRILLSHPNFPTKTNPFGKIRDMEEGESTTGKISREVKDFCFSCSEMIEKTESFSVKLSKAIPSINYFRIDDEAFWGPYLIGGPSRNLPTMIISKKSFLFERLEEHFTEIWDNFSEEVPKGYLEK